MSKESVESQVSGVGELRGERAYLEPELEVGLIEASPLNPRKRFDEGALQELAESIAAQGVLQPIVVRPVGHGQDCRYSIVMGERRWRAAQLAGLETMPAMVHPELTDAEHVEMALVENLQRQDMDPLETAEGLRALQQAKGYTQQQLAERVGIGRSTVANALRLLELPERVQERIRAKELTPAHGITLLRFKKWPTVVEAMATLTVDRGWAAGDLERHPLPFAYDLEQQGLLLMFDMWNNGDFVKELHKLDSERVWLSTETYGHAYCFDPEWAAKVGPEIRRKLQEKEQKQLQKAAGVQGEVVDLNKLGYKKWRALDSLDQEVRKRLPAELVRKGTRKVGHHEIEEEVVVDLGALKKIERQVKAEHREKLRATIDAGLDALRQKELTPRLLALITYRILSDFRHRRGPEPVEMAAALGVTLPRKLVKDGDFHMEFSWEDHEKGLPTCHVLEKVKANRGWESPQTEQCRILQWAILSVLKAEGRKVIENGEALPQDLAWVFAGERGAEGRGPGSAMESEVGV